ncbi:MAG: hypothetical protein Q8O22_05620 [Candidatus Omnitrophota bacterium]|nr:hypothetical protein [Candidatus Omnitrophota bacterium]
MKKNSLAPALFIIALVLLMSGRYLLSGVPHEFLGPEFKGTFEGDYDFTLELVRNITRHGAISLWSSTYSAPIFVFAANLHVLGQALLYFLTHNLALSIKIYQVLYFMLAGLSMFFLALYLYKSRLAALFSAVLYAFTPFFIGEMLSYLHYSTTYFCLPLAFLFIFKALDAPNFLRYSLVAALVIAFNLLSHPQNVFIAGLFYFLFALGVLYLRPQAVDLPKALKIFFWIAAVTLLLSLFFILPTLIEGYPWTRSLTEGGTWTKFSARIPDAHSWSHSQSLFSAITLFHWPWFITPLKNGAYPAPGFMLIYALPFIMALAGVYIGLRDKKFNKFALLFLLLGAVSFLFSLGMRLGPFSLFSWAYKFIPYFHMARAPYRYFYQGVLSICLLSGFLILKLPRSRAVPLLILVLAPYLYAADFYANRYNWTFIPAKEPAYFSQVQDWLRNNNADGNRVVECFGTPGYLGIGQRMFPDGLDLMARGINKDYLDKYLSLFGIKYVLSPRLHSRRETTFDKPGYMPPRADSAADALRDEEEYYSAQTTEFRFVTDRLSDDPAFKMFSAGTRDVAIFENKTAFSGYRLYPAVGLMVLGGSNAYDFLSLKKFDQFFLPDSGMRLAPLFIAQSKNLAALPALKKACPELILHNTDFTDLFFLLNQEHLVKLSDFSNPGWIFYGGSYGILQPVPAQDHSLGNFLFGDLCFSDFAVATDKQGSSCNVTLQADKSDYYRIVLRVFGADGFGALLPRLDGKELAVIDTSTFRGFQWVDVWDGNLEKGRHQLELTLINPTSVFLDALALVPDAQLYAGLDNVRVDFKDIPVNYLINRQNILRSPQEGRWGLYIAQEDDYAVSLSIRAPSDEQGKSKMILKIDTQDAATFDYAPDPGGPVSLIRLGKIRFSSGKHSLVLKNIPAKAELELVSISNAQDTISKSPPQVDYAPNGSGGYRGRVNSESPFVLVHTEANYPGWKMSLGGRTVEPIVADMFLNAFIVDSAGESKFKVFYRNGWQTAGIVISLITLAMVLFLIMRKRKM